MNPQEDIGNLIREKFNGVQQSSDAPIWERIEDTLHKRKRKRGGFFWIFGMLFLLLTTIGTIAITSTSKTEVNQSLQEKITNSNNEKQTTTVPVPAESTIIADKQQQAETPFYTLSRDISDDKKESRLPLGKPKSVSVQTVESTDTQKNNTPSEPEPSRDTYEVERTQTVYHYYNSKNDQEVKSTDKSVIDSTMRANTVKKDSLQ